MRRRPIRTDVTARCTAMSRPYKVSRLEVRVHLSSSLRGSRLLFVKKVSVLVRSKIRCSGWKYTREPHTAEPAVDQCLPRKPSRVISL